METEVELKPLLCERCGVVPVTPQGTEGVWREHFRVKCGTPNCYGNSDGISFDNAADAVKFWNTRAAAVPSVPGEDSEAVEAEQGRWQDAIRDHLVKSCGIPNADGWIDGAGCDSGDPLDVSLTEISQVINYFIDAAAPSPPSSSAEIARRAAERIDTRLDFWVENGIDSRIRIPQIEALITAELAATLTETGWRDIKTAPKDETNILGWNSGWNTCHEMYWVPLHKDWSYGSILRPTHWMPLPSPPESRNA